MNILVINKNKFESLGWHSALKELGHHSLLWNPDKIPAFDIFQKFKPEVVICYLWEITRALFKCLYYNNTTIILRLSYGPSKDELDTLEFLKKNGNKIIGLVDNNLTKYDIETRPYFFALDNINFYNENLPKINDVIYYGEHEDYKEDIIQGIYDAGYRTKVFGTGSWSTSLYLGDLDLEGIRKVYNLSHICLSFPSEVTEIYNILGCNSVPLIYLNRPVNQIIQNLTVPYFASRSTPKPLEEAIENIKILREDKDAANLIKEQNSFILHTETYSKKIKQILGDIF